VSLVDYPSVVSLVSDFSIKIIKLINKLPYFMPKLAGSVTVQMTKEPESWSFQLPKLMDDDGQPVTLSVDFGAASSFCYLTDVTSIDIDDISKIREGMFLMTFMLNDGKDTVRITFSLFVTAAPPDPVAETTTEETAATEEAAGEEGSEAALEGSTESE